MKLYRERTTKDFLWTLVLHSGWASMTTNSQVINHAKRGEARGVNNDDADILFGIRLDFKRVLMNCHLVSCEIRAIEKLKKLAIINS